MATDEVVLSSEVHQYPSTNHHHHHTHPLSPPHSTCTRTPPNLDTHPEHTQFSHPVTPTHPTAPYRTYPTHITTSILPLTSPHILVHRQPPPHIHTTPSQLLLHFMHSCLPLPSAHTEHHTIPTHPHHHPHTPHTLLPTRCLSGASYPTFNCNSNYVISSWHDELRVTLFTTTLPVRHSCHFDNCLVLCTQNTCIGFIYYSSVKSS